MCLAGAQNPRGFGAGWGHVSPKEGAAPPPLLGHYFFLRNYLAPLRDTKGEAL